MIFLGTYIIENEILICIFIDALWIRSLLTAGYLLGEVEFIRKHIDLVCLGIISISVLPILVTMVTNKLGNKA